MEAKDFGDGRTMHTLTMEAAMDADEAGIVVQEIAIVYTDIDPPTVDVELDDRLPALRLLG